MGVQTYYARGEQFRTEIIEAAVNKAKNTVLPGGAKMKDDVVRWINVNKIPSKLLTNSSVLGLLQDSKDDLIEIRCFSKLAEVIGLSKGVRGLVNFLVSTHGVGGTMLVKDAKTGGLVISGCRANVDPSEKALLVLSKTNNIRRNADCSEQLREDKGIADPDKHEEHLKKQVRFR